MEVLLSGSGRTFDAATPSNRLGPFPSNNEHDSKGARRHARPLALGVYHHPVLYFCVYILLLSRVEFVQLLQRGHWGCRRLPPREAART